MALDAQKSDVALMLAVRRGEECAFEVLHERYQHRLLNFFFGMCGNAHMANDLCQETFLRVWRVRKRYRATGSFAGYLFGIARLIWLESCRVLAKERRLGIRRNLEEGPELAAGREGRPDVCAVRSEAQERILAALAELPEEQRMVFVMRNIKGLPLDAIASALDCPLNTVRSRKILAVKKLRYLLSGQFVSRLDRVL